MGAPPEVPATLAAEFRKDLDFILDRFVGQDDFDDSEHAMS